MEPSEIPSWIEGNKSNESEVFQALLTTVECPERTIPIRRTQKDDYPPVIPRRIKAIGRTQEDDGYEYALVWVSGRRKYNGARATINVWNPEVERIGEHSIAQIWISSGPDEYLNTMEAGWMATAYDDTPRFFIYWTSDGYDKTGCYDHDCSGFVQTNNKVVLGLGIKPVSTYNGKQYDITITIRKDTNTGHWWLELLGYGSIGYWPDTIFTSLKGNSADRIDWGGEVVNGAANRFHTKTQMGSGHFPREGFKKASYFLNLQYSDTNGRFRDSEGGEFKRAVTSSSCYDLIMPYKSPVFHTYFFYGGPGGGSRTCKSGI